MRAHAWVGVGVFDESLDTDVEVGAAQKRTNHVCVGVFAWACVVVETCGGCCTTLPQTPLVTLPPFTPRMTTLIPPPQIPSDTVPFNELPDMKAREICEAGKEALRSGEGIVRRVLVWVWVWWGG